ncbi:MAG: hypothetical protein NUV93_05595 [Firmicutes bacterium]|jgi:hypothetical protein|nr:hypothetical protein [Bacillota bacterium]
MFAGRRVVAFVGPYGSGKTEVSINFAVFLRRTRDNVAIVDLDVVTPYCRTREARAELEALGLRVVYPREPISYTDLPVIPAEARGLVGNDSYNVVLDVGGDPAGARAFGSLADCAPADSMDLLFVVNTRRPFTGHPDGIASYLRAIEAAAGRKCTGLVSNTHLGSLTTAEEVRRGYEVASQAGRKVGLPVVFTCAMESLMDDDDFRELASGLDILPLRLFMRPPWGEQAGAVGGV